MERGNSRIASEPEATAKRTRSACRSTSMTSTRRSQYCPRRARRSSPSPKTSRGASESLEPEIPAETWSSWALPLTSSFGSALATRGAGAQAPQGFPSAGASLGTSRARPPLRSPPSGMGVAVAPRPAGGRWRPSKRSAQRKLCPTGTVQRKRLSPGLLHQQSCLQSHLIAPRRSCAWPIRAAPM